MMENDELKNALKDVGSAAIVLGPGAMGNNFIGMNMSGYEKAVVTLSDGGKGPVGNNFIGGEFKRFQPEVPAKDQVSPVQTVAQEEKREPWYKQLGIQIAATVIAAVVIAALVWIGIPLSA